MHSVTIDLMSKTSTTEASSSSTPFASRSTPRSDRIPAQDISPVSYPCRSHNVARSLAAESSICPTGSDRQSSKSIASCGRSIPERVIHHHCHKTDVSCQSRFEPCRDCASRIPFPENDVGFSLKSRTSIERDLSMEFNCIISHDLREAFGFNPSIVSVKTGSIDRSLYERIATSPVSMTKPPRTFHQSRLYS